MTNEPNNPLSGDEDVRVPDEKTPLQYDETTAKDEAQDYLYTSPKRVKKKHRHHSHGDPEKNAEMESVTNYIISDRSNTSEHHHHHHSSSHSGSSHHHHHHHHHHHGKKRMKTWKKVLLIVGCALLSLVLITVGTTLILFQKGGAELYTNDDVNIVMPDEVPAQVQDDGQYIVYKGENYKLNENITSMLFMGVDKRDMDDEGIAGLGGQSDVIVVMAADLKAGKIRFIAVPRDIVTDVAVYSLSGNYVGMEKQQICLAYAYGDGKDSSCQNVLASVRRLFYNIPINTYFALDLDGISEMNDAVGGVDVTSPETIAEFVEGEDYHLVGMQAEDFVRQRRMDRLDANTLRMERQQIYTKSFLNKVIAQTKEDITVPVTLFNESAPYSCTNLNPARISVVARDVVMGDGMNYDFKRIECDVKENPADGRALYYVKEEPFFELFLDTYYQKVTSLEDVTTK